MCVEASSLQSSVWRKEPWQNVKKNSHREMRFFVLTARNPFPAAVLAVAQSRLLGKAAIPFNIHTRAAPVCVCESFLLAQPLRPAPQRQQQLAEACSLDLSQHTHSLSPFKWQRNTIQYTRTALSVGQRCSFALTHATLARVDCDRQANSSLSCPELNRGCSSRT